MDMFKYFSILVGAENMDSILLVVIRVSILIFLFFFIFVILRNIVV